MTPNGSRKTPPDGPAGDTEDIDSGLALERTEMAWARTAIAFAAVGGAILKTGSLAGIAVLALAALVWGIGRIMRRHERAGNGERRRLFLLITIAVTAVSLIAVAVAVTGGKSPLAPQ